MTKISNSSTVDGRSVTFDEKANVLVSATALSLTALLYVAVVTQVVGLSGSRRSLILFGFATTVIPMLCGAILCWKPNRYNDAREFGILLCRATILSLAAGLSIGALVVCLGSLSLVTWASVAWFLLKAAVAAHAGILAVTIYSGTQGCGHMVRILRRIPTLQPSFQSDALFLTLLAIAMLITFRVEPGNPLLNVAFGAAFGMEPKASAAALATAAAASALILLMCLGFIKLELTHRDLRHSRGVQCALLIVVIAAVFYCYFDTSLRVDTLHFLTNVGPATQVVYGSKVPMVSAFSQYGPGPMLVTLGAFLIDSPSFGAANITSQLHSLVLYAVLMVCLFRMTRFRFAGLTLGFLAVGVMLAGWVGGDANMNVIPSSMGLRYLPNCLVVLAISLLPLNRTSSPLLFLAMVLSAAWSFETLSGSVAIAGLFILLASVEHRSVRGFVRDAALVILLPIAVALLLMTVMTVIWTGEVPNFRAYLAFALIYNMTSNLWSVPPSGSFLGWVPVLTAAMVTFSLAWARALAGRNSTLPFDSQKLMYRFAPVAALTAFMSSYFGGRSVDFTLILSFVPLTVLVLPFLLETFRETIFDDRGRGYLAVVPAAIIFLPLSFSLAALYSERSPYSFAFNQCVYQANCSPASLATTVAQRYSLKPLIDREIDPTFFDTSGLVQDALALIDRYARDRKQIPLFLGAHPSAYGSVHTNAVLQYSHKGHRWPISFVLTDALNATLWHLVVDTDVRLEEGEVVFTRADESRLDSLESNIMTKIRSTSRLCPLPGIGGLVTAYRVSIQRECSTSTR